MPTILDSTPGAQYNSSLQQAIHSLVKTVKSKTEE